MNLIARSENECCAREMERLRVRLRGWICPRDRESITDERWAEIVLQELHERGFVFTEKAGRSEVLVCLRRQGCVQVGRAPNRPLAVARTVRVFADSEQRRIRLGSFSV